MTGKETSSPDIILLGERAQQLDMLLHVQEFSTMSVLITGPADIGKSSLLNAAHGQLSVHHQVILIDAFSMQTLADIIEHIAQSLGCSANLIDLDTHLVNMAAQQETLHLLIDDAHLLDDDILQLILEKSTLEHGWHVILSGDESLKPRLNDLQSLFENKLYHLIELAPLTEEESENFITQYYKNAGVDVMPLSMKDIHQLWQLSKGVPGKLVELITLEQDHQTQRSIGFPIGHVAAVLLIVSALVVSLLYQEDQGTTQQSEDLIAQLVAEKQQQGLKPNVQTPVATNNKQAELSIEPEPISKPVAEVAQARKSEPLSKSASEPLQPEVKKEVRSTSLVSTAPVKPKPQVTKQAVSKNTHPLLTMPSQSFALQLLGVRSKDNAESFVRRFSREIGSDKLNIYETRYRGQPWFVVVYGPIDSKPLANEEAYKLSKTIKSQPWVRPISKIQDDIRQIAQ